MYNITSDDYIFAENGSEWWAVRLTTNKWKDTIYRYGKVQLKVVNEETGDCKVNFQYEIVNTPSKYSTEELTSDKEFNEYIGDILHHIITDAFDSGKYLIGDKKTNANDSNNNSEESDKQ